MQTAICLSKVRNKHITIVGYNIQLANGEIQYLPADQLKVAIREGNLDVTNLRLASGNKLIDKGDRIPSVFNFESVKKINDTNKPKKQINMGNPRIALQLITIREKQQLEYWIRNKADNRFFSVDKNRLYTLAIEHGIEGIELDGRKIVNIACIDENEYKSKVSVPYEVVKFLSLLCLANNTLPHEVSTFVLSLERKQEYEPEVEGRNYTLMIALREQYKAIQSELVLEDFKAILEKQEVNKYYKVYSTLFSWYKKKIDSKVILPDYLWENIAHITGLPTWYIPLIKEDLYIFT